MVRPRVIVFSGYGLNCEEETAYAFNWAGAASEIVHINDLIDRRKKLANFQIISIPGGFSYGDDTGAGKAYANKMKNHLKEEIGKFVSQDKLVIGLCNGFQILVSYGLLPGALVHNTSARYVNRWVDLEVTNDTPWLKNIKKFPVPVAHGEGKYFASAQILTRLKSHNMIALRYTKGDVYRYQKLPPNPNGAMEDIAGITSKSGRILGLMPHPDRAIFFTQLPYWPLLAEEAKREGKPLPTEGPGLQIFKNGVEYFK